MCVWFCFVFKQKTAYELRISDWSSDVCSSDLTNTRYWSSACSDGVDRRLLARRQEPTPVGRDQAYDDLAYGGERTALDTPYRAMVRPRSLVPRNDGRPVRSDARSNCVTLPRYRQDRKRVV